MPRPPAKIDWGPAGRIPMLEFTAAIPRGPEKPAAGDGRGKGWRKVFYAKRKKESPGGG